MTDLLDELNPPRDHESATLTADAVPLLIFVGVTGVGKSTTLAALESAGGQFTLLPDRRTLTDAVIIPAVQRADGEALRPITDRTQRFDYTRRYRERYPGGMAHALAQLPIAVDGMGTLCFDGLRGAEEVAHAAEILPLARFVVLDAPDTVRVERLLNRADAFDQVGQKATHRVAADLLDMPGVDAVFDAAAQEHLRGLVASGAVDAADLRAKVVIVVAERQNYDPAAAIAALHRLAPARTLVVDTAACTPAEAAARILSFIHH